MSYKVTHRKTVMGHCPPGHEHVNGYKTSDGKRVDDYCRKITASGRVKAGVMGLYNEAMIAQEDVRMGFDSLADLTVEGERNAKVIKKRSETVENIMKQQEESKKEAKE